MDTDGQFRVLRKCAKADHKRLAILKAQYAVTVPFNIKRHLSCQDRLCLLEKVEARRGWFVEAGKRDLENRTQLGTLNYLPREIRDVIYSLVLNDAIQGEVTDPRTPRKIHFITKHQTRITDTSRHLAVFSCHTPRPGLIACGKRDGLEFYQNTRRFHMRGRFVLRDVSASIRTEFEHIFLWNGSFVFCCSRTFVNYFVHTNSIMQATPADQKHLKHIVLEIFGHCNICGRTGDFESWKQIAKMMPPYLPSLQSVQFDLGAAAKLSPEAYCTGVTYQYIGDAPTDMKYFWRVKGLLEEMTKQWKRRAPNAEISVVEARNLTPNTPALCVVHEPGHIGRFYLSGTWHEKKLEKLRQLDSVYSISQKANRWMKQYSDNRRIT